MILRLVELRRIDRRDGSGSLEDHLVPGGMLLLHAGDKLHQLRQRLFAIADDEQVDEIGHRLGRVRQCIAGNDDRVLLAALIGMDGDLGQVQHRQHVGNADFVGQGEAHDIEVAQVAAALPAEQRHGVPPHDLFSLHGWAVGAVACDAGQVVEHVVEQMAAKVADSHGIGIGKRHRNGYVEIAVAAGGAFQATAQAAIDLQADVLTRGRYIRQELTADKLFQISHLRLLQRKSCSH